MVWESLLPFFYFKGEHMVKRLNVLRAEVTLRYPTIRLFVASLSRNGMEITEQRFSRILTGHTRPKAEEKRLISWKLQRPIRELFPSGESDV
jgi:hypothetical protein